MCPPADPKRESAEIHVGDVPAGTSLPAWYSELLDSVSTHITEGHRSAVKAANTELLGTYWSIGREILERQQQEGWGAKVIDRLSADLKSRFPDARGYSPRNLKYMLSFAAACPSQGIVQGRLAQSPWYHHLALLDKLDEPRLREWNAAAAVENGWSRDILAVHLETRLRDRPGKAVAAFAVSVRPDHLHVACGANKQQRASRGATVTSRPRVCRNVAWRGAWANSTANPLVGRVAVEPPPAVVQRRVAQLPTARHRLQFGGVAG